MNMCGAEQCEPAYSTFVAGQLAANATPILAVNWARTAGRHLPCVLPADFAILLPAPRRRNLPCPYRLQFDTGQNALNGCITRLNNSQTRVKSTVTVSAQNHIFHFVSFFYFSSDIS